MATASLRRDVQRIKMSVKLTIELSGVALGRRYFLTIIFKIVSIKSIK